ncbi:MAG: peptidylprolyl isomerase [Planctomycetota bacterium]|nr:peptidylprolyl isomerase [Planctomycetota bacterium]
MPKAVIQESPIVALVGSRRIRRDDLWPSLIEIGGKTVMDEHVLNLAIELALQEQRIKITQQDIEHERDLLATSLSDSTEGRVDKVLKMKGYGSHRKNMLLFRNAALRKLISKDVVVTESAKKKLFSIVYGASYPARIIVVSSLQEATEIISILNDGASFKTMAIKHSIDSSSSQGGYVNPINVADPIWPTAIRDILGNLKTDEFSSPILINDKWAIIKVTGKPTISDVKYEDVKTEILQLSKLALERLLMEQLSLSLIEKHSVTLFDENIKRALSPLSNDSQ